MVTACTFVWNTTCQLTFYLRTYLHIVSVIVSVKQETDIYVTIAGWPNNASKNAIPRLYYSEFGWHRIYAENDNDCYSSDSFPK